MIHAHLIPKATNKTIDPIECHIEEFDGCEEIIKAYEESLHASPVLHGSSVLFKEMLEQYDIKPKYVSALTKVLLKYPEGTDGNIARGRFIGECIQRSYKQGHNDFAFHTENAHWIRVGLPLRGTAEKPIKIRAYGEISSDFFSCAEHIYATINGNVHKHSLNHINYSTIYVYGDVIRDPFQRMYNSNVYFEGENFDIIWYPMSMTNCTLHIKNKKAYELFQSKFHEKDGNIITLLK